MDLFTYLMAKNGQNTGGDLFSYLLGKGGSGTYTTYTGTSLNISNTIKAQIKKFMLNSTELSQDGTPTIENPIPIKKITGDNTIKVNGKNLYDESKITDVSTFRSTATINDDKSITITSTGTNGYAIITPYFNFKANETYTVSFDVDNIDNYNHMYLFINTSTTSGGYSRNPYVTITKTTDSLLGIGIYPNANATITISNIQIEKNSSKTSYKPYQEQNYPITLSSKNLLNVPSTFTFKGTYSIDMELEAGNYTLSWSSVFTDSTNTRANIIMRYEDDTTSGNNFVDFNSTNIVLTPAKKVNRIYFYSYISAPTSADITITYNNLMLEQGSTATSYEPYYNIEYCKIGDYADQISNQFESKNLFKAYTNTGTVTGNTVTYTMNSDSSLTINGTATGSTWVEILADFKNTTSSSTTKYLSLDNTKNYTLKATVLSGTYTGTVRFYAQTNSSGGEVNSYIGNSSSIANSDGLYRAWFRVDSGTSFENCKIGIQLEEGTTATSYEPYYNIEYCKIEDYRDQIFKNTTDSEFYDSTLLENEWYLKKNIGKVTFDGSESGWNLSTSYNSYSFWKPNNQFSFLNSRYKKYCNLFQYSSLPFDTAPNPSLCENTGTLNMMLFKTNGDCGETVDEWKEWLSSHHVQVYCPLATPTYTHISESDYPVLKQELDNLYNNAKSYNGQTNITQTNDDLPFNISVDVKVANL